MNATTKYSYADAGVSFPAAKRPGLIASIKTWFAGQPYRRQILAELRGLSDRELADIGLARCDLHRVFDPEFVATYRS